MEEAVIWEARKGQRVRAIRDAAASCIASCGTFPLLSQSLGTKRVETIVKPLKTQTD